MGKGGDYWVVMEGGGVGGKILLENILIKMKLFITPPPLPQFLHALPLRGRLTPRHLYTKYPKFEKEYCIMQELCLTLDSLWFPAHLLGIYISVIISQLRIHDKYLKINDDNN